MCVSDFLILEFFTTRQGDFHALYRHSGSFIVDTGVLGNNMTFIEPREVFIEHLQRVQHASKHLHNVKPLWLARHTALTM